MKLWLKIPIALISAAAVAGAGYFSMSPSPTLDPLPRQPELVSTTPLPLQIVCPGPLVELGGEDGTDIGSLSLLGKANIWSHNSAAELANAVPDQITQSSTIALVSKEQTTNALSALQTQVVDRQRMVGVAASNCSQPVTEGSFATGMASVGRESILLISNPLPNEVQVYLEFALSGGVKKHLVTLAGFEHLELSLAQFVDAEPNFAVNFSTNGPAVTITMQLRTSSGLTATGVDLVPATKAETDSWIPGLTVFPDTFQAPQLRIFNPQAEPVKALVTFIGIGNDSDVFEVEVPAQQVVALDLTLPVGEYLVRIQSDEPVVSAIWSQRIASTLDFAWLVPSEEFFDSLAVPVPQLASELVVVNTHDSPITVSLLSGASYQSLTIPAQSEVRTPVQFPLAQVQSANSFRASLQIVSDSGFAVVAPTENQNLGSDLSINVR